MTLNDAVQTVLDAGVSTTRNAVKRPSWAGYATVSSYVEGTGAYTLTFKDASGDTFAYSYNGSAWTAPGSPISVSGEFMAAILAADWITGKATDFESARAGGNEW